MKKQLPENKSATILYFPQKRAAKRGRPKSAHKGKDLGTPELNNKRLLGETAETLDLLLERRLISPEQHFCGIHLRWLYTIRFGAPSVRTIDPTHIGGYEAKTDDPQWRVEREKDYQSAIQKVARSGHAPILLNICVHNHRPGFLNIRKTEMTRFTKEAEQTIEQLRSGLDILMKCWKQKGSG